MQSRAKKGGLTRGFSNVLRTKNINYIVEKGTKEKKKTFLRLLTQDPLTRAPRPAMMLLRLVDTRQSTSTEIVKDWATAYDFVTDLIHIKPFVSKKDHHPLGDIWDLNGLTLENGSRGLLNKDMVRSSPGAFTKDIVRANWTTKKLTTDEWYKMSVCYFLGEWTLRHWGALKTIRGDMHGALLTSDLKKELGKALDSIFAKSRKIRVPVEEQFVEEPKISTSGFEFVENCLVDHEGKIRDDVRKAWVRGYKTEAENAAEVYEGLLKLLSFSGSIRTLFLMSRSVGWSLDVIERSKPWCFNSIFYKPYGLWGSGKEACLFLWTFRTRLYTVE